MARPRQPEIVQPPVEATLPPLDPLPPPPSRQDIGGSRIYRIRGALLPKECQRIVAACEAIGFRPAGLATGDDGYRMNERVRNNERIILEDRAFVAALWARVGGLVEPRHEGWRADGLNWRLRIYRYQTGQYFRPHLDVRTDLPGGGQTRLSFMIYLNDGFEGGETTFFERKTRGGGAGKPTNRVAHVVRPAAGDALAFDHLLLHEGSAVKSGVKYAIRSDLVYRR